MEKIVKLAVDTYFGRTGKYSAEEANDSLRQALIEANGGSEKLDMWAFQRNPELFQIISQALTVIINEGIQNQFDQFADVMNIGFGDSPIFEIEDPSLFEVAVITDGTTNLLRQRLDSTSLTLTTKTHGVKIYEEFTRLLAGRINWTNLVNRVGASIVRQIKTDIYQAIANSYSTLDATFKGTGALANSTANQDAFKNIIMHIESSTESDVVIYGTRKALSGLGTDVNYLSNNMKDELNQQGFLGVYQGWKVVPIKQAHQPGTYNFAIDDNMLLLVPQVNGQKIVKILNEGDAIVRPVENEASMNPEYTMIKKYGVGVLKTFDYGIWKLA